MALILELPADIERELTRDAQIRGVPVQTLAVSLIGEAFATKTAAPTTVGHSAAQIRAWLESLAEFSAQIPAMPTQTFTREMIYSDHS
jgi:hypothetical protein